MAAGLKKLSGMDMTPGERPLISFGLLAYNQERFITESVLAAFAQTYSPLQIILSDDCSSDSTFRVMQQMAGAYHGPHQLVLNQNPHNRGICAHVNRVAELAKGEMIVGSAGDDISLPERTELCYQAWRDSGGRSASIWSDYSVIDESGNMVGATALRSGGHTHIRFEIGRASV